MSSSNKCLLIYQIRIYTKSRNQCTSKYSYVNNLMNPSYGTSTDNKGLTSIYYVRLSSLLDMVNPFNTIVIKFQAAFQRTSA